MAKNKTNVFSSSGFTIVEIIVVIVVIGVLTGLVTNAFSGLQDDARDNERKTDIQAYSSELETYYSDFGKYPSVANMNDSTWVETNLRGIEVEALTDPKGGTYRYVPAPVNCDNVANDCVAYVLYADLEEDGFGADDADADTDDLEEKSLHNGQ